MWRNAADFSIQAGRLKPFRRPALPYPHENDKLLIPFNLRHTHHYERRGAEQYDPTPFVYAPHSGSLTFVGLPFVMIKKGQ
ncbi:hypothetical protein BWD10_11015 [Neisseria zoodegmatis]|uniref:Uncharacterized protein n=1 Tax=Neisseria zoodegmatis TaxID=326523 RepID=A0ABX3WBG9_9NEIS|nr:hypothetical protein BWD10_11015 [Neisseria zoodegmatis]